jgi:folate-dependent phosphoribosylglycinamide formyltransferase PurN
VKARAAALVPCAIFVSGGGTNLQAVIDAVRGGMLPLDIRLVVSNSSEAFALERARKAGIATLVIEWDRETESRSEYAMRLADAVRWSGARLVLLLGWMHVLAKAFLEAGFDGVLNLHPSYLPDDPSADSVVLPDGRVARVYRGAHALRDAIEARESVTGATLIEITPLVDRGPVLARRTFALQPDDDEAAALARLHEVEHEVVVEGILNWLERKGR